MYIYSLLGRADNNANGAGDDGGNNANGAGDDGGNNNVSDNETLFIFLIMVVCSLPLPLYKVWHFLSCKLLLACLIFPLKI